METMPITEFKATCLAVLEEVGKTGRSLVITKRGKPVAQINPPPPPRKSAYGCMKGSMIEIGDIMAPLPIEDWGSLG